MYNAIYVFQNYAQDNIIYGQFSYHAYFKKNLLQHKWNIRKQSEH